MNLFELDKIRSSVINDFLLFINSSSDSEISLKSFPRDERKYFESMYVELSKVKSILPNLETLFYKSALIFDRFCYEKTLKNKYKDFRLIIETIFNNTQLDVTTSSLILVHAFQQKRMDLESKYINEYFSNSCENNDIANSYWECSTHMNYLCHTAMSIFNEGYSALPYEVSFKEIDRANDELNDKNPTWIFDSWKIVALSKDSLKPTSIKEIKAKNIESYSHSQIAIAVFALDEVLDSNKAASMLEKYSTNKSSEKLLTKRILRVSELITLTKNKTADTKHLQNLIAAKRLVSGMKKTQAIGKLNDIIDRFKEAYNSFY